MKPGRELDALIAEHVMSLQVVKNKRGGWSIGPADYYDDHGCSVLHNPLPAYSEEIAAAFEVLEKLDEDLGGLQTEIEHHKNSAGVTLVWRVEPRYREVSAVADKLPEAICLAALKVKGIEP